MEIVIIKFLESIHNTSILTNFYHDVFKDVVAKRKCTLIIYRLVNKKYEVLYNIEVIENASITEDDLLKMAYVELLKKIYNDRS